jgi:nicotinate-nucleotide pyrophosphorylase
MLRAVVTAKAAGVAAGVETARRVFTLVDPATVARPSAATGTGSGRKRQ